MYIELDIRNGTNDYYVLGFPTMDVLFPSITICPQGQMNTDIKKIVEDLIEEQMGYLVGNKTCEVRKTT